MSDLTEVVTRTADAAELHAPVPTLLLELQSLLGALSADVAAATDRGRRPFRPTPQWSARLGELGYRLYLLADQSGVDVDEAVRATAAQLARYPRAPRTGAGQPPNTGRAPAGEPNSWPFTDE